MKILDYLQEITDLTKTTTDKQRNINLSEVFHLWNHLVQRYHVIYITNTLASFVKDEDLKFILQTGSDTLNKHVTILEQEMLAYGLPLPNRPPKQTQNTANVEIITDRYSYRRVLRGIQSFLST